MEMIEWYKEVVLNKYATFEGRASKSEFWWFVLANFIISFGLGIIGGAIHFRLLANIYSLAVLVPSIAVEVRRLHDIGKSGWNLLWAFVPIVGIILLIIWFVKDGDPEENQYGPVPSDTPSSTTNAE